MAEERTVDRLDALRRRIDELDEQLVAVLEERARLAVAIQDAKGPDGHGHDVPREREVVAHALARASGDMAADELEMVLSAVVRASRSMQRRHAATRRAALVVAEQADAGRQSRPA